MIKYALLIKLCMSALLSTALTAHAVCNDSNNWLQAPGKDTKIFVNEESKVYRGQGDFIQSPETGYVDPYPPSLEAELRDKPQGEMSFSKDGGNAVYYYEPDGKGEWRICRIDHWISNQAHENDRATQTARSFSQQYVATSSALAALAKGFLLHHSTQYYYDKKGRRERETEWYYAENTSSPVDIQCFRYDEQGRVILETQPHTTKKCSSGEPDIRDSWTRYRFGVYQGKAVALLRERHSAKEDGSWIKKFSNVSTAVVPDHPTGGAEADSKNGVTQIYGSNYGKLDDNAANTVVDEFGNWNGASYFFTKPPVPLAVLDNPDLIYQYERRRQTYVEGSLLRLYELFKPNEHISRHRYYSIGGYVTRHEQLDAQGRITRIITVYDYRQPRPGPHPDFNDKLLTNKGITLHGHEIYHRVYDIDANGKPKLVAISWNRERFPLGGLNKLKKTSIVVADVVYGTPNGKEKWKTRDAFEKAFDTSRRAKQVFPDVADE